MLVCAAAVYVFHSTDGMSGWSQVSKLTVTHGSFNVYERPSVSIWNNVITFGGTRDHSAEGQEEGEL